MATYKIQNGDTLSSIAKKYKTTVDELTKLNNISNPNLIYSGNTLNIPDSANETTNNTQNNAITPIKSTADFLKETESVRPQYQIPEAVLNAQKQLQEYEAKKPGEYQSQYAAQIDNILDGILNRKQFSYDFNADPIYQQYKNQYITLGNQAMQDTMGNAAALTGGYGNSYASTAGNQAYQAYLAQLNNIVPELADQAYTRYQNEGNDMINQLSLLKGMDESDYGRYRDNVGDYYNDLNYFYSKYNNMSAEDYNRYLNDLNAWQADRNYYYQKAYDEQQQANIDREWAYMLEQDALKRAQSGGGGSYGGGSSGNGYVSPLDETGEEALSYLDELYYRINNGDSAAAYELSNLTKQQNEQYQTIRSDVLSSTSRNTANKYLTNMVKKGFISEGTKENLLAEWDSQKGNRGTNR